MLFYGRKYQSSTVLRITHGNNTECKFFFLFIIHWIEKTEAVIKNGQYRKSGNIRHTRHTTKTNKTKSTAHVLDTAMRKQTHTKTGNRTSTDMIVEEHTIRWSPMEPQCVGTASWDGIDPHTFWKKSMQEKNSVVDIICVY